jgi:hypothetical protein
MMKCRSEAIDPDSGPFLALLLVLTAIATTWPQLAFGHIMFTFYGLKARYVKHVAKQH